MKALLREGLIWIPFRVLNDREQVWRGVLALVSGKIQGRVVLSWYRTREAIACWTMTPEHKKGKREKRTGSFRTLRETRRQKRVPQPGQRLAENATVSDRQMSAMATRPFAPTLRRILWI